MQDFQQLCDQCAAQGVQSVLTELSANDDIAALAKVCSTRAQEVRAQGDAAAAERLTEAVQYLTYLLLPYD
jgi:hypothetical protein